MSRVTVGIHVHAEPERLNATLSSLRLNTRIPCQLVLLPDGADPATRSYLASMTSVPQLGTSEPRGAAACFNRLAAFDRSDIIVIVESGSIVGPHWLEHIVAAFDSDDRIGLAGPSTNANWNAQCVFPNRHGTAEAIADTAREAVRIWGSQTRTLEPLYSLADFCYAVRREVIDEIGAADEAYATGPCWEMDYSIRAQRAGWSGVWVCASYVWRAPFTARRKLEEQRRFETNKHLYQNRFCGARLRGEKTDFRDHCSGDACPNFAPAGLITTLLPLLQSAAPPLNVRVQPMMPLVSCIMPTANRRPFIPQAIRNFQRQDHPNAELIIIDDGTDPIADCVPVDDRIRYCYLPSKFSTGAKRNTACEMARGDFIFHWDDDDWYPTWRIRRQVDAMLETGADISGTSQIYYFDPLENRAWEYRYGQSAPPWVGGNTLAYKRSHWERNRFPDIRIGEDARFIWSAGRAIHDLHDPALCIATVHGENTSRKHTSGSLWHPCAPDYITSIMADDVYFYYAAASSPPAGKWPMVSCIMPTWNRRPFVRLALESFQRQDYPNRELIVIDDGTDPVGDLLDGIPNARYIRLTGRTSIGAKRNIGCQNARGEIVAHWDDDDWFSPDRLRYQAAPILLGQTDITGLENSLVLQLPDCEFWTTCHDLHKRMFVGDVHGGTLVFRRQLWEEGFRYPETSLAEDAGLLQCAIRSGKRLTRLTNPGVFVYVRHNRNAWRFKAGTFLNPDGWSRITEPPLMAGNALGAYREASELVQVG